MPDEFYQALISATSKDEARLILKTLVEKKLIAGGMITDGESLYWWNQKPVEKIYFNLSAFTTSAHQAAIIREVKKIHSDKTPIIAFFKIEAGNAEFLSWIKESVVSCRRSVLCSCHKKDVIA